MLSNVPFFFKKKNLGENDLRPSIWGLFIGFVKSLAKSSLANRNSFGDKGELPWNPHPGIQF